MNSMKRDFARRLACGATLFGAFFTAACDSINDPDISPVGTYGATTFVTTTNGVSTNHIANGSTIVITLASGGTTSGQMHFVASGGDPAFDANLAGTWTRSGSTVTFDHAADTFIKDMPFIYTVLSMSGDMTLTSGTRIQLTLSRAVD